MSCLNLTKSISKQPVTLSKKKTDWNMFTKLLEQKYSQNNPSNLTKILTK